MQETLNFSDSSGSNNQDNVDAEVKPTESHFWVACDDNFNSSLVFTPSIEVDNNEHIVIVYDASGERVSETKISFPENKLGYFELDSILGECKNFQGMRQAHIHVLSQPGAKHQCIVKGKKDKCMVSSVQSLNRNKVAFFPLRISPESKNIIAVHSFTRPPATVKCRLFTGTRTPEIEFKVNENGAISKEIETEFEDYLDLSSSKPLQAYVRIITNSSAELGIKLIEKCVEHKIIKSEQE